MRSHFLNEFFHWEGFDGIVHRGGGCFCREGGLPAIKRIKRRNTALAGDLPAAKSVKEYIVAVEESWTAKENEIGSNFAVAGGLSAIKCIKRRNTAVADDLPAAKSEKENIVAVERDLNEAVH